VAREHAGHGDEPTPEPFLNMGEVLKSVLIAVMTYLAVSVAQKPAATAEQLHNLDKRLAVLENMAAEQKELNADLRTYLRRGR
jgi:hypothetical protein